MRWSREELLIVLNLYFKIPFGKVSSRQPVVVELAERLGRTPGSISMKIGNFASFDPSHRLRGVGGLPGASRLDRDVWEDFHANPAEMIPQSQALFDSLFVEDPEETTEVVPGSGIRRRRPSPPAATEYETLVKRRRGQDFFREIVLNNYSNRCGLTGFGVRELLVASHILPWSGHERERLNVRNGICLNRLHDSAFDLGFIGFDENLRLRVSDRLRTASIDSLLRREFLDLQDRMLDMPHDAIMPSSEFLAAHRLRFGIN